MKSDTFRCAAKSRIARAPAEQFPSLRWLPNASHSLPRARWKLLSYTLLYGLSCRMSSNPSRDKRSAVANSLAASFPVTLNAASLRSHVAKMEWRAVDRAREERKGAEIYAPSAFDDEITRIIDIARSNEGARITKL